MNIVIAEKGKFIETLQVYAGSAVAVLPHGDWSDIVTSDDPFAELLQCPSVHPPTYPLE